MPTFNLIMLLKKLPVQETKDILKRTGEMLLDAGAVIREIDNLGLKKIPYRMIRNRVRQTEGNFFVYTMDISGMKIPPLLESLKRDMNIIRHRFYFKEDRLKLREENHECDIHYDLLKVPDRPHVKLMVALSKKKEPKPFRFGGGRNHDLLSR